MHSQDNSAVVPFCSLSRFILPPNLFHGVACAFLSIHYNVDIFGVFDVLNELTHSSYEWFEGVHAVIILLIIFFFFQIPQNQKKYAQGDSRH